MKKRYAGFGALVVLAALAACGGGGGGTGGGVPPTAPPPASVYTGTQTIANDYNGYPPCPTPQCAPGSVTPYPNNVVTSTLKDSVSASSGTVTTNETITQPNQQIAASLTVQVTPSPNGSVQNIGERYTVYLDDTGYSQTLVYPTPLVVDQEPENNGANWANTAQANLTESFNDGTVDKRTTNFDGTYTETETNSNTAVSNTATVNADASGSWVAAGYPFYGYFSSFTWTAPSGGNVTFTGSIAGPAPTPSPQTLTIPAFFPTTQPIVASNTSNSSTITTGVTFPGSCAVPSTYGTSGNDVHTVVNAFDPLFGFTEQTTTDAYTSTTYGLVCARSTDVLTTYYDWNGDNHYFLYASNTPLIVTKTTTTLTLQSGSGVGVASRRTAAAGSQGANAPSPALLARELTQIQVIPLRAKAKQRVLTIILHHQQGGARL
ncbi:MAG: hypothetical protein ACREMP_08575 [Candidatus Tyrphobacter sp.]